MLIMKKGAFIGFLIYLVFGLYFLNSALNFIVLPEFLSKIDKWILLVGAILIIIGAINYLRLSKIQKIRLN